MIHQPHGADPRCGIIVNHENAIHWGFQPVRTAIEGVWKIHNWGELARFERARLLAPESTLR